jgi:hypothetical protein
MSSPKPKKVKIWFDERGTPQTIYFKTICHDESLIKTTIDSAIKSNNLAHSFKLQPNNNFTFCSYSSPNILVAKFIAAGGFNNAYEINVEGKKRVLRLTKTSDSTTDELSDSTTYELSDSTTDELIGYLMQMQLKENCPDGICGMYDFGLYSTDVRKQKRWGGLMRC